MKTNMHGSRGPLWRVALAGAPLLILAACQSTPAPGPEQMSRTTTETAPADLQLLCADAAARSSGVDGNKVLPVGSSKVDATSYRVQLNAGGTNMVCMVGDQGTVSSVGPA